MNRTKEIVENLTKSVVEYNIDGAAKWAREVVQAGIDPLVAIEDGLAKGIQMISDKFQNGEIFITELVIAAEAMKSALTILQPELSKRKEERKNLVGRIAIGTVAGDIHSIGRNILGSLLFAAGFEVQDLGEDVSTEKFLQCVKETKPEILGLSALMTTTLPAQRDVIEQLKKEGLRNRVKVILGGAAVNEEWTKTIGADGYASTAVKGVNLAKQLLRGGK